MIGRLLETSRLVAVSKRRKCRNVNASVTYKARVAEAVKARARGDSLGCECDLRDGSRRGHDPTVPARPASVRMSVSAHARSLAWTEMTDARRTPRSRSPPPVVLLCRSPVASSVTRSEAERGGTRLHSCRLAQALNIERCRPRLLLGRSAGRQPRLRGRAYYLFSRIIVNRNYESTV